MMSGDPSVPVPADGLAMIANPFNEHAFDDAVIARNHSALQHNGPRPLPPFLALLQKHFLSTPKEAQLALVGLRKIQALRAPLPRPRPPVLAQMRNAMLHDYGGTGPRVVVVPSLINPPDVLDITTNRSMLRWLSTQGLRPALLNWGEVTPQDAGTSISDYVTTMLVPMLRALNEPVQLVGYCLGGTMALAAAQLHPVRSLTLIAAPWRFGGYPPESRAAMTRLWADAAPIAERMGYMPIEVLQLMFWQLDPHGTVQKYARFAKMAPESDATELFIAMEHWANGGAPLPFAAARELFADMIADDLPGCGGWVIDGRIVTPRTLGCPLLDIVSLKDRIVPAATATGHPNRREINSGHVGMITGSQAKSQLWEPLREWLSQPHDS